MLRKRKISNASKKTVGLEYYEDFSGALDGREVPIEVIVQSQVNILEEGEIVGSDMAYTVERIIYGVEQSWSVMNALMRKEGYRNFVHKVYAIKNQEGKMTNGDRVRIQGKEYTVYNQDPFDRENFTVYYLTEIARNENERPA